MSRRRIVYLHGFASGPRSTKGEFFREKLAALGLALELPDLTEGDFEHSTISRQLAYLERLAGRDRVVLFGSSMGGYLAALSAARHAAQIEALVLMAPAFGLARRWADELGEDEMRRWRETGHRPFYHYAFKEERQMSYDLIADGLSYEEFPATRQPALVFHGRYDRSVDYRLSERFAALRPSVELVLFDSDHQLLDVLEPMWARTRAFLAL